MDDPKDYDAVSAVVFLLGIYQGVIPLVARLVFGEDAHVFLSLPLRLDAPWVWVVSVAALVVAVVLLGVIDAAKTRRFPEEAEAGQPRQLP